MILHNGPIYTMDPRLPQVRALAVAGALIAGGVDVREGDSDTVGHERIDLDGRCVLPGFTDAHVHFLDWALERTWLDLHGCRSLAEACAAVGAAADGDGWLRGKGWLEATWPDGPPHRAALDEVTGERPAALWAHDHHTLWVNSAALRAAGAEHPTGVLQEWDAWRFPVPPATSLERSQALREGMAVANARGVIGVHDFQAQGGRGLWQRYDADRRLTLRVAMSIPLPALEAAKALELRTGFGSALLADGTGEGVHGRHAGIAHGVDAGRIGRAAAVGGRPGGRHRGGHRLRPGGGRARDRRRRQPGGAERVSTAPGSCGSRRCCGRASSTRSASTTPTCPASPSWA